MSGQVWIGSELPEITALKARIAELEGERDAAKAEAEERATMAARAQEALRYVLNGLPANDAVWAAYGNADSARAWLAERDAKDQKDLEAAKAEAERLKAKWDDSLESHGATLQQLVLARAGEARAVKALTKAINELRADLADRNPEAYASRGKVEPGYCEAMKDIVDGLVVVLADLSTQPALAWLAQVKREAAAEELAMLRDHIQEYIGPDDARDEIRRICANRIADLRAGKVQDDPRN